MRTPGRVWALVGLAALGACSSIPDPGGAVSESAHYRLRADFFGEALLSSASSWAEKSHGVLERALGGAPEERLTVILYHDPDGFTAVRRRFLPENDHAGAFFSPGKEPFAALLWSNDAVARTDMEHELVHWFVSHVCPGAADWWSEGLAHELAHSNFLLSDFPVSAVLTRSIASLHRLSERFDSPELRESEQEIRDVLAWASSIEAGETRRDAVAGRCPVLRVRTLEDSEIRESLAALPAFRRDDPHFERNCQVAGAVVRWAIATRAPGTLAEIRDVLPEPDAFLAWLRALSEEDVAKLHDRFPPLSRSR
jgi:hypothetical protein